jgi:small GTP-binding protein
MVGAYAVGKTSLVERFVHSIYSERYHTTIGVKIDTKVVQTRNGAATCVIWDIAGEDEFYTVRSSYLRGMRGYLLVVDGTRRLTVEVAQGIHDRIRTTFGPVPFVLLANKKDLEDAWELRTDDLDALGREALAVLETSALTGDRVEDAFDLLVEAMIDA